MKKCGCVKLWWTPLLLCLLLLASCERKRAEVAATSVWTGSMEVQGIPLSGTLTLYSDRSFILDTTVTFFGVGMNFNKVGQGTVQGEEGELLFTLEALSPDIVSLLESAGGAGISLPLTIPARLQDDTLVLEDMGLAQRIVLTRQPSSVSGR